MGCGSCGTGANGKPAGCNGNGGCGSGGCNRMNVYDWLNSIPLYDGLKTFPIIEVSFNKGSRKEFFRNNTYHIFDKGDMIAVEGVGGYDIGMVSLTGELIKLQLKKYSTPEPTITKRVLHPATEEELQLQIKQKEREAELLIKSRALARGQNLDMKLCEVEVQADGKKGTFFYTADQRVDFRELIKVYAGEFKMKIEMRQIGARQESGKVGGIGSCGRELCCSTWLSDFKTVNTTAARYQNLSINQTKLSGQCGRLKCCLNYELDTYMDALSVFPDHADSLETAKGVAQLQKRDIFKNLMWYSYSDNNKQYPLTIARVKEILALNRAGQKAEELQPVELEAKEFKAIGATESGFVNDVGQMTLKSLDKGNKKKKHNNNKGQNPQGDGQRTPNQPNQGGNRPQQQGQPQQPRNNAPQGQGSQTAGPRPQGNQQQQQDRRPPQGQQPNQRQGQPQKPRNDQQPRPQQPQQQNKPKPQGPNQPNARPQNQPPQDGNAGQGKPAGEPRPQNNQPRPPQQPQQQNRDRRDRNNGPRDRHRKNNQGEGGESGETAS